MKTLFQTLAISLLVLPALGFSPATPWRHVVASGDKFVFVMEPGNFDDVPAKGIAYKATRNSFQKMWSLEGWYEFPGDVLLSADGKTVVRIRERFLMQDGSFSDDESKEFLTIFRRGKRVAGYTAEDLIKDLKDGIRFDGFSGMKWVDRRDGFQPRVAPSEWHHVDTVTKGEVTISSHPDVLQLTTLEGMAFLFDLKSGSILSRRVLNEEKPLGSDDRDPFAADADPLKTTQAEQDNAVKRE
ncbi:MAG: hypothetical protein ACSHX6_10135 [Akkermansiaceae bacterium]